MPYDKKTWTTLEIINLSELQHMEDGIDAAHTTIDELQVAVDAIPDVSEFITTTVYDPNQDGKVVAADVADALANGGSPKTYTAIAAEIDSDIATHTANTSAHHARYTNAEAVLAINADTSHGTSASHSYRTDEEIRDVIAAFITQGSNITVTHNDAGNTLTIASSGLSSADRIKFDGIETGATADMNGTEIVAAINASSALIDADNLSGGGGTGLTQEQLTKLNGIETGATADQNATEIIGLINASELKIDQDNLNLGNLSTIIERGFIGEVVVGDCIRIYNPRVGTLQSVTLISGTQPSGESLIVDIRKNGVATTNSIFSSDTPMMLTASSVLTSGGVYTTTGSLDNTQINLVAGDILRVYVTQTGATVDVSVCLEVLY